MLRRVREASPGDAKVKLRDAPAAGTAGRFYSVCSLREAARGASLYGRLHEGVVRGLKLLSATRRDEMYGGELCVIEGGFDGAKITPATRRCQENFLRGALPSRFVHSGEDDSGGAFARAVAEAVGEDVPSGLLQPLWAYTTRQSSARTQR